MYDVNPGIGGVCAAATTACVATLPNTGSNILLPIALSVAAGLLTWGILYARKQRANGNR